MGRDGRENLIPQNMRTKEEQIKIATMGGKASGKARKEKADLRRQMQLWMESDVGRDSNGEPMTGAQMMVRVAVKELSKGNPKFWELARDTAGFKPVEKVMIADVDQSVIDEVEAIVCGGSGNDENDAVGTEV